MIDDKLAQTFVDKISTSAGLHIQIIDTSGFVIASDQPRNSGMFHELAYQLLCGEKNNSAHCTKTTNNQFTACFLLNVEGDTVGVVEVTSGERDVYSEATLIKLSLETMLSYGKKNARLQKYENKFDLFIQRLFYDSQTSLGELESRAITLGYKTDCMRIPVFIVCEPPGDMTALIQQSTENPCYNSQDIITLSRSNRITLYIYLGYGEQVLRNYRTIVTDYLQWWEGVLSAQNYSYTMNVGSIQNTLTYYRVGYDHAVWLHNIAKCQEPINWFYDYTKEYIERCVPLMEYRGMFNVFSAVLSPEFLNSYVELISSLSECNYSLKPASQMLFIHKNTLSFRMGKVKDTLGINPMQNYKNREFANNLCHYLKKILP